MTRRAVHSVEEDEEKMPRRTGGWKWLDWSKESGPEDRKDRGEWNRDSDPQGALGMTSNKSRSLIP